MKIADFVWPPFCVGCKKDTSQFTSLHRYLCPSCLQKIKSWDEAKCPRCNKPSLRRFTLCKRCAPNSHLQGIIAASSFQNPILKEVIHKLKYSGAKTLSLTLSALLAERLKSFLKANKDREAYPSYLDYLLTPVPLSSRKKRTRGFNQAQLLASSIHSAFEIPINSDILKRRGVKTPQAKIKDAKKRRENIKGAFVLNPKRELRILRGKKVFIVDDVATTGATLEECAKILEPHCREIWGLVVAA